MWLWLIKHPSKDLSEIPFTRWSISEKLGSKIVSEFVKNTITVIQKFQSKKLDTTKFLLQLQDGHQVEAVIMKHSGRNTLCVSSQVGCQMGCRFCATGTMGIIGNLKYLP
jgi:adenine C2-methylase RlmN of 23S rRNA A2503 and tRNA A37